MTQSVWEHYSERKENQRLVGDEDLARFFGQLPYDRLQDIRALDWGAGDGRNGELVRRFYPQAYVIGYDPYIEGLMHSVNQAFYSEVVSAKDYWPDDPVDVVIDCMVSQHFPWGDHPQHFQEMFNCLKPGGWYFLKHLNIDCSDALLCDQDANWTWANIPDEHIPSRHFRPCYPNNGLVSMPPHGELELLLNARGLFVQREYLTQRHEQYNIFSHSVFFCQKPA